MKVYLCKMSENDKHRVVKVVSTFEAAKKWQHDMVRIIIEGERLYARYLLSIQKTRKVNKDGTRRRTPLHPWFAYRRKHNLRDHTKRHSPYFEEYEVEN